MKIYYKVILLAGMFASAALPGFGQQTTPAGWHLLDKQTDGFHGISLQKAYNLVKDKKAQTVVVAVIDGGTDTTHEDLKDVLWINKNEIAGNDKDDDKNGYTDDVKGWNFLGNTTGSNLTKENMEAVRLYHQLKGEFENQTIDTAALSPEQKKKYAVWLKVEEKLNVSNEDKFNFRLIKSTALSLAKQDTLIMENMGKKVYTIEDLEKATFTNDNARRARFSFLRTAQMLQFESDKTNKEIFEDLNGYIEQQEGLMTAKEKPFVDYRTIVGDNPADIGNKLYGNMDVMGGDAKHGTHVAGIIGAARNNGKGGDGVANNVVIMTLRAVPDGDEYDKDVALAIRYAADNGAKVVNMSFGKEFSPHKQFVDDAIRYAASKDVLLVHAAGNDSENLDEKENYPSAKLNDNTIAQNMITVGASGDSSVKNGMIATFTNYGKTTVDVLAPGVKIYATVPTANQYAFLEGTSMAAPVVSGIAALIRGYYPTLTAVEVKKILMESVDKSGIGLLYKKPGIEDGQIAMTDLCVSGGIVNAYNALLLAEKVASAKTKTQSSKK